MDQYLTDFPELMKDWDLKLNSDLDPSKITCGSHKKVNWHCHKCGRVWRAAVKNRVQGTGCSCDASERKTRALRKTLVRKYGSLAQTRPDLAAQWHPQKNGDLTPHDITAKSTYKAWWIDSNGRIWQAEVAVRNRSKIAGDMPKSKLLVGYNDLKTLHPAVAAQWHPTRNGELLPEQFFPGSDQKVWWCCEKGHAYQGRISVRTRGSQCPVCTSERNTSFPEQAIYYYLKGKFRDAINRHVIEPHLEVDIFLPEYRIGIEYDGSYYHRTARKQKIDAQKNTRLKELGIRLIRVVEEGNPIPEGTSWSIVCCRQKSKLQLDDTIQKTVQLVNELCGTSYAYDIDIERDRPYIMEQYIRLEKENSLAVKAPQLLSEWNSHKNGTLKPEYIPAGSSRKVWWKCGKCGYEWAAGVYNRVHDQGCPVCSGLVVVQGINDLGTTHPALAEEWHTEKNGDRIPQHYSAGSGAKVWWICRSCGHEWSALISNRSRNQGCPQCAGKVTAPDQSLAAKYPHVAAQWHPTLNGSLTPADILPGSERKVWWLCDNRHSWEAIVRTRTLQNRGCPYCANQKVWPGFNDLATVHPELVAQWDAGNPLSPSQVSAGSTLDYLWNCARGHTWKASVYRRAHGNACPYCTNRKVLPGFNDLATTHPHLAEEWDHAKNEGLTPQAVTSGSNAKVHWICKDCKGEWAAYVFSRSNGRGCPYCAGKRQKG